MNFPASTVRELLDAGIDPEVISRVLVEQARIIMTNTVGLLVAAAYLAPTRINCSNPDFATAIVPSTASS